MSDKESVLKVLRETHYDGMTTESLDHIASRICALASPAAAPRDEDSTIRVGGDPISRAAFERNYPKPEASVWQKCPLCNGAGTEGQYGTANLVPCSVCRGARVVASPVPAAPEREARITAALHDLGLRVASDVFGINMFSERAQDVARQFVERRGDVGKDIARLIDAASLAHPPAPAGTPPTAPCAHVWRGLGGGAQCVKCGKQVALHEDICKAIGAYYALLASPAGTPREPTDAEIAQALHDAFGGQGDAKAHILPRSREFVRLILDRFSSRSAVPDAGEVSEEVAMRFIEAVRPDLSRHARNNILAAAGFTVPEVRRILTAALAASRQAGT